jgi:hypothetical protein
MAVALEVFAVLYVPFILILARVVGLNQLDA